MAKETKRILAPRPEDICLADDCAISFVAGSETMRPFAEYIVRCIFGEGAFEVDAYESQQTANLTLLGKGVRPDLIIQEKGGRTVDVEAQRYRDRDLVRRIDAYWLELAGLQVRDAADYRGLRDVYVVFVCDRDYLGRGEAVSWIEPSYRGSGEAAGSIFHGLVLSDELIGDPGTDLEWMCRDFFAKDSSRMHGKEARERLEYLRKDGYQTMILEGCERREERIYNEGRKATQREMICNMISAGFGIDAIAKVLGVAEEEAARMVAEAKAEGKK